MNESERTAAEQPFEVRPESTGEMLARVRETQGRTLRAVANDLRIRFVYLEALEEGRYADLPGQTYAVGFLRTYSDYLGLNAVKVVERYKEEISGLPGVGSLVFPVPEPEGKIPGGLVVVISLLLLALAYGGWYVVTSQSDNILALWDSIAQDEQSEPASTEVSSQDPVETPASDTDSEAISDPEQNQADSQAVAPASEPAKTEESATSDAVESAAEESSTTSTSTGTEVPAPAPAAEAASANEPTEVASETVTATSSNSGSGEASSSASQGNLNVVVTSTAEVQAQEAAAAAAQQTASTSEVGNGIPPAPSGALVGERTPRTYGEVNENSRILLQADNDSWVQVRNQQDDVIFTQVLHKGDVYRVPDIEGLTLLTGNAGGLQILVDGKIVPTLGPVGEVRRDVSVNPASLLSGETGSN